jgi:tetratricopeptide (TPR) repeat protein
LPFYSNNPNEWEHLHKNEPINPLPHDLFPIVKKCLEKTPDQRYENFDELKDSLIEQYQKITKKSVPSPPMEGELEIWELNNKGISLFRLGLNEEAKLVLKDSIKKSRNNPVAYNNLGLIYESREELDKAKIGYVESLRFAPDYPHANNNLGNILLNEGNCDDAIKHFKKAIRSDNSYYTAYFNLANTYYRCGKPLIFAIKKYFDALNINPNYAEAYGNLGVVAFDLKWFGCSEKAYNNAIKIKPDYEECYYNLGNLYRKNNQRTLAIEAYRKFIHYAGPNLAKEVENAKTIISKLSNPI